MENQGIPNQSNVNQVFNQQFGQQHLPNATAVLVLGIISLPVCICYFFFGIPGLILSIISLSLSNKAKKLYDENPSAYTVVSYNNLKAGRICAIIGIIINAICFLIMIFAVVFLSASAFQSIPWH